MTHPDALPPSFRIALSPRFLRGIAATGVAASLIATPTAATAEPEAPEETEDAATEGEETVTEDEDPEETESGDAGAGEAESEDAEAEDAEAEEPETDQPADDGAEEEEVDGGDAEGGDANDGTTDGEAVDVQILNTNDFHGRLEESASVMACTVDHYREENDNVIFTSSGDMVGASTFTSFAQDDEPTLDALNAMGMDVASLGNHEFDQGADDFDDRIIPHSDFPWVGANARDEAGDHLYEPYSIEEVGGVRIGFIGLNTEDMPNLVSPDGIEGIEWTSMSEEANYYADYLTENDLADVVTVLVHEGLPEGPDPTSADGQPFGDLINNAHPEIEAIFSGHTHQEYVHDLDGMWLTQAGEYADYLSSLSLSIDPETGEVLDSEMELIDLFPDDEPFCEGHAEVDQIVSDAVDVADEIGSEVVATAEGDIPFARARNSDGSENRGGASTLGQLIADAQLWAMRRDNPDVDFALTNSGGLRADLPLGDLTMRDLGTVQPFANTLVNVSLTGEEIYELFEAQWLDEEDRVSRYGQSENVRFTYDTEADPGERVTGVWIDEEPVQPDETYQVSMNNFMAAGGDESGVPEDAPAEDTGLNDLEAFVDYAEEQETLTPELPRTGVGVHWGTDPDATYSPGDDVALDLSGLAYSHDDIPAAETVSVQLDGEEVAEADVDLDYVDETDDRGQAEIRFEIPTDLDLNNAESADADQMQTLSAAEGTDVELLIEEPVTGTDVPLTLNVTTEDSSGADEDSEDGTAADDGTISDDEAAQGGVTDDDADESAAADGSGDTGAGSAENEADTSTDDEGAEDSAAAAGEDPTAEGTAVEDTATEDTGSLARTGAAIGGVALGAALLIAVGFLLLRRARREIELFD